MANKNGWQTTKDNSTGNWILECKGTDSQGNDNFDTQEKIITVDCANKNFTGDLVVDVKARDAVDKYSSSSNRYTASVNPAIQFSSGYDNRIITTKAEVFNSFDIAENTGWIKTKYRYYKFTSNQAQVYSDMYFNPTTYTVQDSYQTGSGSNYRIIHDEKILKIIEGGQFTNEVDFGVFKARFSNFTLSNNSVTTSVHYNEYKIDDVYIEVGIKSSAGGGTERKNLKVGGALFMRSGKWYSYTQPGSASEPILPTTYGPEDIEYLYIIIPDVWESQDAQGHSYNGIGRTATITQTSIYLH